MIWVFLTTDFSEYHVTYQKKQKQHTDNWAMGRMGLSGQEATSQKKHNSDIVVLNLKSTMDG